MNTQNDFILNAVTFRWTLIALFLPLPVAASHGKRVIEGDIDRKFRDQLSPAFHFLSRETVGATGKALVHSYTHLDGTAAVTEQVLYKGKELAFYRQSQHQLGTVGTLEIRDGKAHYSYTRHGEEKHDVEDLDLAVPFVAGPGLADLIAAEEKELSEGGTVRFRLPVLERQESFEFEIKLKGVQNLKGVEILQLEMRPSSSFISMLVSPIRLEWNCGRKAFQEIRGRLLPLWQDGNDWIAVEGVSRFNVTQGI